MQRTINRLFRNSVERFPANPMMWEKSGGEYKATDYRTALRLVEETAAGLIQLGLGKGDRVTLLSEGRNDWVFSELGILFAGGVDVPLSIKLQEPAEIRFRIQHSGSKFVIVSGRQLPKILPLRKDLPELEKIIVLDEEGAREEKCMTMADVRRKGWALLDREPGRLSEREQSVMESDPANICYTSGTTADPKGIVLTHRNYTANVEQARAFFELPERFISLLILPWDHSFAHTCGVFALISGGASMASVETGDTAIATMRNIGKNIKEIRPTLLLSVPALSENFKSNIERQIAAKGRVASALLKKGLQNAYAWHGDGCVNGRWKGNPLRRPLHAIFDRILFSKIREGFGGRLEYFVGGGALLDIGYQRFFAAIGIPVYQGYGLTEAAPVISANRPGHMKMGTSGRILPNLEVRICDDDGTVLPRGQKGEIVVKGENVMQGYWRNPEATASTIRDGWLYTGDMGFVDEDGYLVVLGRFKSLLISDIGEKFSPEGIEESLNTGCPFIKQIMLFNSQKPYTTALIVPDPAAVIAKLKSSGLTTDSEEGQRAAIGLFAGAIRRYFTDPGLKDLFPSVWLPAAFALLDEPFTEANGFINSTMKMVRWKIIQHHQKRLDHLYTAEGKDPFNSRNREAVRRLGQAAEGK
ncbi:MAG: AMP-binding protein [bacterium]|nr:AMP-binding protein [bacterium]